MRQNIMSQYVIVKKQLWDWRLLPKGIMSLCFDCFLYVPILEFCSCLWMVWLYATLTSVYAQSYG